MLPLKYEGFVKLYEFTISYFYNHWKDDFYFSKHSINRTFEKNHSL